MDADQQELVELANKMAQLSQKIIKKVEVRMEELQEREDNWKRLQKVMDENATKAKDKIVLDIGGKRYTTSKSTLLAHPGTYFSTLLQSGLFQPGEDGSYFIDRNPKPFSIILEYLRTGKLSTNSLTEAQQEDLKIELDYYQMIFPDPPKIDSVLLSASAGQVIKGWIGNANIGQLLWRASSHGFGSEEFYLRCKDKKSTLVVLQTSKGWICGGYATCTWKYEVPAFGVSTPAFGAPTPPAFGGFSMFGAPTTPAFGAATASAFSGSSMFGAPTTPVFGGLRDSVRQNAVPVSVCAFLFTLQNPHKEIPPTKYPHVVGTSTQSLGQGPMFGQDLTICLNHSARPSTMISTFPQNYSDTTGKGKYTFSGEETSYIKEIEVFEIV